MCVAIAGGIKGIESRYQDLAHKHGITCKLYNQNVPDFDKKIGNVEALILLTDTVSHKMARVCLQTCKRRGIRLKRIHSSSLSQLEKALQEVKAFI